MNTKKNLQYIILAALCTTALILTGYIKALSVGFIAVPITVQNGVVFFMWCTMSRKSFGLAMTSFFLCVLIGIAQLSSGLTGVSAFIAPTSGFVYAWFLCGYLVIYRYKVKQYVQKNAWLAAFGMLSFGILIQFGIGILFFTIMMDTEKTSFGVLFFKTLWLMIPFAVLDLCKGCIVLYTVRILSKIKRVRRFLWN